MIKYKKGLVFFYTFFVFVLFSFLWKHISLPLNNSNNVVGPLSIKDHNPFNDTLRYILIVLSTLTTYLVSNLYLNKNELINIQNFLKNIYDNVKNEVLSVSDLKIIILFLIGYIFIEFFYSVNLKDFSFDTFHDGDFLTAAQNYAGNKKIWSSSITIHGGSNTIYTLLGWKLFANETIGAYRFFLCILVFFIKILSLFLAFQLTKLSKLNKNYKIILFTSLSLLLLSFSSYEVPLNYFELSIRDWCVILFVIFLIQAIYSETTKNLTKILLIFIPFLALTLHIDIGVYLYFIFIVYLIYLAYLRKYKIVFQYLLGTLSVFLFFLIIFGQKEFVSLINNILIIAKNVDLIHALEFPQPIFGIGETSHGSRATRVILFQILSGIFIIDAIIFKKRNFNNRQKVILIFLYLLSFIMFKNALGRSDSYHIRMSSEWPILITSFFLIEYFFRYLEKRYKMINFKINHAICVFIFILTVIPLFKKNNIALILNFKNNYNNYMKAIDDEFLDPNTKYFLNDLKRKVAGEKCIVNFTADNSIPYLIKKPSCTKYILPYLSSGNKLEKKYIEDISNLKPKFIIYNSPNYIMDNINMFDRLKTVNSFMKENYIVNYDKNGFIILEKKID